MSFSPNNMERAKEDSISKNRNMQTFFVKRDGAFSQRYKVW